MFTLQQTGNEWEAIMNEYLRLTRRSVKQIIESVYKKDERLGFELEAYFVVDVRIDSADHDWHN